MHCNTHMWRAHQVVLLAKRLHSLLREEKSANSKSLHWCSSIAVDAIFLNSWELCVRINDSKDFSQEGSCQYLELCVRTLMRLSNPPIDSKFPLHNACDCVGKRSTNLSISTDKHCGEQRSRIVFWKKNSRSHCGNQIIGSGQYRDLLSKFKFEFSHLEGKASKAANLPLL